MRAKDKWWALGIAHLIVVSCLTAGVGVIAVRLGEHAAASKDASPLLTASPPSDSEIARVQLLSARIEVLQKNLANADTVAFKRHCVFVEEDVEPRLSQYQLDMAQGALEETNRPTDLAIQGDGFFHVKIAPTVGDGTAYTRNGRLRRSPNGELMIAVGKGYPLIPPLTLPLDATNLSVQRDGTVRFNTSASPGAQLTAGRVSLCRFVNAQALGSTDGLYTETAESGRPFICNPGDNGTGILIQGFLESSNVDPLKEWAALLRAQQMLQLSSQAMQIGGKTRRVPAVAGIVK